MKALPLDPKILAKRVAASKNPRKYLLDRGAKRLSSGCYKITFSLRERGWVVKLVSDSGGAHEIKNFKIAPKDVRAFLLPILAERNSKHKWYEKVQVQEFLSMRKYRRCNGGCELPMYADFHQNHYHHKETKEPVVFDYGQRCQW